MEPLEKYEGKLKGASRADHETELDALIDISIASNKPIVITSDGKDVGVVANPTLLRGIQGGTND